MIAVTRVESVHVWMVCRCCGLSVDADLDKPAGDLVHLRFEGSPDGWPHEPVWVTPAVYAGYLLNAA